MGAVSFLNSRRWASFIGRLVILASVVISLSACRSEYDWHQKLTVTVNTPTGEKSGSSVVGIQLWFGRLPLSGGEWASKVSGEATVVEVAPGQYLFALLGDSRGQSSAELALQTFWDDLPHTPSEENWRTLSKLRATRPVPLKEYPLLVTFADINDPKSARRVDPQDLAAAFGPGFELKSITLEITDDSVSSGFISSIVGWVDGLRGSVGKDQNLPYDHILNKLSAGSFRQGG